MRILLSILLLSLCTVDQVIAQSAKLVIPPNRVITAEQKKLTVPPSRAQVPLAIDPFQVGEIEYKPLLTLNRSTRGGEWFTIQDENNLTTFAQTTNRDHQILVTAEAQIADVNQFLAVLPLSGVKSPVNEFVLSSAHSDEQGNQHFRMNQVYNGIPVYGSEVILHTVGQYLQKMNGRYYATPSQLNTTPLLTQEQVRAIAEKAFGTVRTNWTPQDLKLIGGQPFQAELVIYHLDDKAHLAYLVTLRPNVLKRIEYFVDAHTGQILNQLDRTCKIHPNLGGHHSEHCAEQMPPVTGMGLDLFDISRSFGAWQEGSNVYMMDATKSMFNSGASSFPGNPVGVIAVLDAQNTSPENSNFNYTEVKSNNTSFSNKKAAVSAQYNAGKCYDYFKAAFNRNSIDGAGGNIISLVNVVESDGSSMENAFWNGDAMWYGNGGSLFQPLARGLDVGGHEMTHGVIEKTANLIYQNQSGALNESFADIFSVMIDRDDWKIGEDVVKPGVSPGGCLRSMENPNNGDTQGGNFWQPKHMNQIYTGTQDNGGVHINSGITNHAFFLFATNAAVGKDKAEQVYYKALRDYLTKNSKFIDCRVAVIQAANDLYGASVAAAAGAAFDAVGIAGPSGGGGGGGTTAPPGNLVANPGTELILVTTENMQNLEIATSSGSILGALYSDGIISRPSVTDKGDYIVFVNEAKQIVGIDMTYGGGTITPTVAVIGSDPIWRNATISKDGRYLAALTDNQNNTITLVDFTNGQMKDFELYNPTYTNGQITDNVQYADVIEFDYSGKFIMYDASNLLNNQGGQDLSYWDIGFLQFTTGTAWTSGTNIISKLFNGLPDNVSVGNPAFSKNSPHIIAFDVIDGNENTYDVFGANTETGDNSAIITNNGDLGWPNFNRLDNSIAFESPFLLGGFDVFRKGLGPDKISGSGNASSFIESRIRPVWYATGTRSLIVSIDHISNGIEQIAVYPNPTDQGVSFALSGVTGQVGIAVFAADGRCLSQLSQGAADQIFVPMHQFAEGVYQLRITTDKGMRIAKVIKTN
jgi:Zn-dependent metalloprotease